MLPPPNLHMARPFYQLSEILAVARHHPFYNVDAKYPLSPEEVSKVIKATNSSEDGLLQYPITEKQNM